MLEKKFDETFQYQYVYHEGQTEGKKPTIIFVHGAGTCGHNLDVLYGNIFFRTFAVDPFSVYAPLCETNSFFDRFESLHSWIRSVYEKPETDKNRFYMMGYSMGGYTTWQMAMSDPELFSAIVPICGGGMYWNAGRLKNVPVWAFHGQEDPIVLIEESRKMVQAVNTNGGHAVLTEYPGVAHPSWEKAYVEPELAPWLLSQTKDGIR